MASILNGAGVDVVGKRIGIMAATLLMASMFGGTVFAESPEDLKEKMQLPGEVEANQEVLEKVDLDRFNLNPSDQKSFRSMIEKKAEGDVLYELEPNDYFDLADNLPFMSVMVANLYGEDIDIYKVKVTSNDQYMLMMGSTYEFPIDELLYGVFDSKLNYIEPEVYELYDHETSYQVVPVKKGEYYIAVLSDYWRYGESYAMIAGMVDTTPPAAPTVNAIDDNDKVITGKAEKGSTVTLKNGKTKLGTPKADSKGNFKLTTKPIKAGSKITATATDEAGNVSKATTMTVADKTAPSLTVKDIYSNSKTVSGKTEEGAKVTVKAGKTTLGSGTSNSKGEFKITIKAQKKNTTITISASDKAKNTKTVTKKVK